VGDLTGNAAQISAAYARAVAKGADLCLTPELSLCGYPPEDLLGKRSFITACHSQLEILAALTKGQKPALLVGLPWRQKDKLYNAMALLEDGVIRDLHYKHMLPNEGVFDEKRWFTAGDLPKTLSFRGFNLVLPICEDAWHDSVMTHLAAQKPDVCLIPNASPYWRGKGAERTAQMQKNARMLAAPLFYLNTVGGQDELVFDGASFALNASGEMLWQAAAFQPQEAAVLLQKTSDGSITLHVQQSTYVATLTETQADYTACVLGLRDYVEKSGFKSVLLGLSGGIDSALVAAIATDALGSARVHAVMLPSNYTSMESLEDARACADALHIRYDTLPIAPSVTTIEATLAPLFAGCAADLTEENIQSRIRGVLLMALSNKFGGLVLTTGNKSEMAVGYATLYGDMNGGFNPIKDVYKTEVYALSRLRNTWKPQGVLGADGVVIPPRIITKAPSAELRPNQTDQDSLPPYETLDAILHGLVEEELSVADIIARGFASETVLRVQKLLYGAEYKRRQATVGVKLSRRAFGRDRRYPIVNGYRDGGS
jgi:NAD+ synthase